jgi:glycosyltransferase involved in cell wall biosynthesis
MSRHSFAYLFERFPSFVQTFCHREVGEMVRQGMDPLILSIREPDDPPEVAESLRLPVTYLPPEKELREEIDRRVRARSLPRAVRRALKKHRRESDSQRLFEAAWLGPLLREQGIRHVHAHFGGMAARTAWWLRKLHGIGYSFTGHANDIFCENYVPLTNSDLAHGARFVVTETNFARRWMEEHHPGAGKKFFRVYNGIDVSRYAAACEFASPPLILSVGRYVEKKGFGDLIKSCRLLCDKGLSFTCQIVGGGPLEAALQQQIDANNLSDSVKLLGPRSQAEVIHLLSTATLFVLPCVEEAEGGSDNLPTVIVEAMAAGVTTISTTIAGVPEMITDGQDGLLVPPHSPPALSDAIERLLHTPALRAELGRRGQETARAKFALATTVGELKHLLVRLAPVTPQAGALQLDPTLASERQSFWRWLQSLVAR